MTRWTTAISATGGLFIALSTGIAVDGLLGSSAITEEAISTVPTVALGVVLLYGGYWLSRSELHPDTYPRVLAWCLGGCGLLLASVVLLAVNPEVTINNPVQTVALAMGIGSVAGFTIGANEARAISRGREAERGREVLGFLNSTLRHEVLNNLTIVRGTATELAKESDDEVRAQLDVIVERCDDLADLINDIGPLARALTGHGDPAEIDFTGMVTDRVDAIATAYPEATVTAEIEEGVSVRASRGLSHALSNVLINAIEHNDEEEPRVAVSMSTTEETVRLRVADNGPGIDEAEKERLFRPDTDRDGGFGLYMVRTLVTHFDGDVRVEDNDPTGTVFTIELPRADAA